MSVTPDPHKDVLQFSFKTEELQKLLDTKPLAVIVSIAHGFTSVEDKQGKTHKLHTVDVVATASEHAHYAAMLSTTPAVTIMAKGCPNPPGCA